MELKFAFFADAATIDNNSGKINVLGIFDSISSFQFPYVHPKLTFVVKIQGNSTEAGSHKLKIDFVDAQGKPVILALEIEVILSAESPLIQLNLDINNFNIPIQGDYSAEIVIDGCYLGSALLKAVKLEMDTKIYN